MPHKNSRQGNAKKQPQAQKKSGKENNTKRFDSLPKKKSQLAQPDSCGGTVSSQKDNRTDDDGKLAAGDNLNSTESLPQESSGKIESEIIDNEDEEFQTANEDSSKEGSKEKLNPDEDQTDVKILSRRQKKNKRLKSEPEKKKGSSGKVNQDSERSQNGESNRNKDELRVEKLLNVTEKVDEGKVNEGSKKSQNANSIEDELSAQESLDNTEKMDGRIARKDKSKVYNSTQGKIKKDENEHKQWRDRSSSAGKKKHRESDARGYKDGKRSCFDAPHSVEKKNEAHGSKSNRHKDNRENEDSRDKSSRNRRKFSLDRSSYSRNNSRESENRKNDFASDPGKAESLPSNENHTTLESWEDWDDSCEAQELETKMMIDDERRKSSEKKQMKRSNQSEEGPSGVSKTLIVEINKDLFEAPSNVALAHCVGADFKMGSGIAVLFRQNFGRVGELLDQRVHQGNVAYIKHKDRYVFYLVTKEQSTGKPTQTSMERSMEALHAKCIELGVHELAIPRIGCGLDRLEWSWVKSKLEKIFADGFKITVYNWNEEDDYRVEPKPGKKPAPKQIPMKRAFVKNNNLLLKDIENGTGLLYIASVEPSITEEMNSLDQKYSFLDQARRVSHVLGKVVRMETRSEVVYGLVCRQTVDSRIKYQYLEMALDELRKINRKDKYNYFGLQAFEDKNDPLVMTSVETLLRNSNIAPEIWICWPPALQHLNPIVDRFY